MITPVEHQVQAVVHTDLDTLRTHIPSDSDIARRCALKVMHQSCRPHKTNERKILVTRGGQGDPRAVGELSSLDALAEACGRDGRYGCTLVPQADQPRRRRRITGPRDGRPVTVAGRGRRRRRRWRSHPTGRPGGDRRSHPTTAQAVRRYHPPGHGPALAPLAGEDGGLIRTGAAALRHRNPVSTNLAACQGAGVLTLGRLHGRWRC